MHWMGRAIAAFWDGIDAYLTMLFAIAVATASFLGLANGPVVAASTLAIFFLIAINILRNRRFEDNHHRSIEAIEQDLKRLSASRLENQSFISQEKAYDYIIDYLDHHREDGVQATLIQYSNSTSMRVLRMLLRSGADVTLFVQHEDTAAKIGSREQEGRITQRLKTLEGDLADDFHPERLHIRKFQDACLALRSVDRWCLPFLRLVYL